jgi:hypothetical protein
MKVNWASLTKEQKQIVVLIGIGVVVVLALLYQFALTPFLEGIGERRQDSIKLRDDLARASAAQKQEVREQAEAVILKARIDQLSRTAIAPYGSSFAWVTEQLYQIAKDASVEVEGLSGSGQAGPTDAGGRTFTTFGSQMTLQCGYGDLLRFLRCLEGKNPLVTVTALTIDGRENTAGRHQISVSLEWPTWVKPPVVTNAPVAGKAGTP